MRTKSRAKANKECLRLIFFIQYGFTSIRLLWGPQSLASFTTFSFVTDVSKPRRGDILKMRLNDLKLLSKDLYARHFVMKSSASLTSHITFTNDIFDMTLIYNLLIYEPNNHPSHVD